MSYIGKIKTPDNTTYLIGSTLYGTCSTAASTAAKVVTLSDFNALTTGVTIHVKFTYSNTVSNPTLNVNNTGAKNIKVHGATGVGNTPYKSWFPGEIISFTYDGTNWCVNDYKDDSNIIFEKSEDDEREIVITDDGIITEDSVPYNFRQSADGDTELDELVGASVAWNQLVNVPSTNISKTENGVTFTDNRDGTISVQTDANGATGNAYISLNASVLVTSGHKYLFSGTPSGGSMSTYYSYPINIDLDVGRVYDLGNGIVFNPSSNGTVTIVLAYVKAGTVIANAIKFKAQLIDLTLMFGSTIADYVYTLEQSTAGSGIAWLKAHFPKLFDDGYKAYNAGELVSVKASAHETVGKNLFDEVYPSIGSTVAYRQIKVPNGTYTISTDMPLNQDNAANLFFLAGYATSGASSLINGVSAGISRTITVTDGYLTVGYRMTTGNNPENYHTQIEIGTSASAYEPYVKHTYPLSPVELRGLYKLDTNNKLYCDGDSYRCDGRVKRRYGIVDLGTLEWDRYTGGTNPIFRTNILDKKNNSPLLCSLYLSTTNFGSITTFSNIAPDKSIASSTENTYIAIRDSSYTDATTFKTAMSGVYLIYELATPTEEYTSPFAKNQAVDAGGTEEYIDNRSVSVPVGHNTKYYRGLYLNKKTSWANVIKPPGGNLIYSVRGTQTSATASWTGNIEVPELYDGLSINYYLPYAGVNGTGVTLNLTLSDGTTTGAKNCYITTNRLTTHYGAGKTILMTYYSAGSIKISGTATTDDRWICDAYYDSNDGDYRIRHSIMYYAGPNKVFPSTFMCQLPDGRWESIVTSSSTGTSKTRNTHGFLFGQIMYMASNATYNQNAQLGGTQYSFNASSNLDTRYSFNTAYNATYGLTAIKPVYLVGTLSNGLFYLSDPWWTQTLPSTEDNKIYIYIGNAVDYFRMRFDGNKKAYVYTNGALREFNQDAATVSGHTVAKDVPSDAVFTDNNTWRNLKYINTADTTADLAGTGPGTGYIVYDGGSSSALKTTVSSGYSSISVSPTRVVAVSASQPSLTDLPKGGIWLQLI